MNYKWFFVLFAAGLAFGVYQFFHPEGLSLGPGNEMPLIARNLVADGLYGDSFESMRTGPTAINPPLYPLFLALCMLLFPARFHFIVVVLIANITVNALVAALLPQVSRLLWGTLAPGIAAGVLSIAASQVMPGWDANCVQLGVMLFCLAATQLVPGQGDSSWHGALAGVALGILFLLNQVVLLIATPWIAFLLVARRTRLREMLRFLIPFGLAALLVNLPWLIRNFGIWGEFVTRTSLGIVLHSSNNDCAEPSIYQELQNGCFAATHPEKSVTEAALLKSMGEPAYDRLKTAEAMAWMRSHPRSFLRLTLARIAQFWFPLQSPPRYSAYVVWIITLLSIPGFFLMLHRRVPSAVFLGAVFLLYPLPYYVASSALRYRVPILWLSSLTAGYFLTAVAMRRRPQNI